MNERIKQLALQSQLVYETTDGKVYNSWEDYVDLTEYVEKFAELIVRECIWALWTEECRTSDLASEEYTRGSNKIKQHFGVKE